MTASPGRRESITSRAAPISAATGRTRFWERVSTTPTLTPDKKNFAPRFGLAYRPFGGTKTVVRGGYGIFYSGAQLMNLVQNSVTGPPAQLWAGYTSDLTKPTLTWAGDVNNPNGSLASAIFGLLTGPENNWKTGYTQQWSLSVAQEVTKTTVVEAQYL